MGSTIDYKHGTGLESAHPLLLFMSSLGLFSVLCKIMKLGMGRSECQCNIICACAVGSFAKVRGQFGGEKVC